MTKVADSTAARCIDLKLEDNDDDTFHNNDEQPQPKRLVKFPSGEFLAYGGDDGLVTYLATPKTLSHATVVRRYDDGAVRAIGVSNDGKRIAVGFDTGTIQLYHYKDYEGLSENLPHPFAAAAAKHNKKDDGDDDDDEDDALYSQDLSMPNMDDDDTCMAGPQFDAPIRDLQFHPTQPHLLAIATESTMCIVDVTDATTIMTRYLQTEAEQHHDRCGIRGLAFSPVTAPSNNKTSVQLASLAMDGRLCVWNVSGNDPSSWTLIEREAHSCIPRKDVGEIHGADPYDRSCFPLVVAPSNSSECWIATPGKLQLQLRRCTISDKTTSIQAIEQQPSTEDGHSESIVAITSSNDNSRSDQLFVTSGRDNLVLVWKLQVKTGHLVLLKRLGKTESTPTHLLIHEGVVYVTSLNGSCRVFGLDSAEASKAAAENTKQQTEKASKAAAENTKQQTTESVKRKENGKGHDKKRKRLKKKIEATKDKDAADDDDDDIDFSGDAPMPISNRVRFVDDEADQDDTVDFDDVKKATDSTVEPPNEEGWEKDGQDRDFDNVDDDDDGDDASYHNLSSRSLLPAVEPQPAFAPSSTPLDLERRFLCWNHIGSITLLQGNDGVNNRNTVDISFTDSATRRPISFTDNMNFIVGSLGDDGAIFASDVNENDDDDDDDDDVRDIVDGLQISERIKHALKRSKRKRMNENEASKPTGSNIYFHRFETFGSLRDKDWHLTLPDGERVVGAACGEGWAAVMTSRRFLRLFTSGGNQAQVMWLPGEPVTMTGRSRFMAVIHHLSSPLPNGTQQLGYSLYDVANFRILSKGPVSCISKGASLSWVGFNNDGSLLAMDTDGMLSMLIPTTGSDEDSLTGSWEWAPVLDTIGLRKTANDLFWPVTVYGGKLVCVPLRGGNEYPDATRRPVTTSLSLRLPLARTTIAKTAVLEEVGIRSNIALSHKKALFDVGAPIDGMTDKEEFEQEYLTLQAQVDKVTLKLFAAIIDAGKLERAFDLVHRLHLEKSFDLAMILADRHRKLADLIEAAKERRFSEVLEDDDYDTDYPINDRSHTSLGPPSTPRQVSPDAMHAEKKLKRPFNEEVGVTNGKKNRKTL